MENIGEEYNNYWETNAYFQSQELNCWGLESLDQTFSSYYDSSSPDAQSSSSAAAPKNIVSERNRRKKLNERLFALRAVVPNITKMDKASIIKDAIEYIQVLHDQEKRIEAEISELEMKMNPKKNILEMDQQSSVPFITSRSKKKRMERSYRHSISSPIEVLELKVSYIGERTVLASIKCSKKTDTLVKLCEVFESLKVKIVTANITVFSGRILKTVFIEAAEEEMDLLKIQIETAVAALNGHPLRSPMST